MLGLTPEDILALEAPLPLSAHDARAKGQNKDKTKTQYLIYIDQEGVIPLLNSIDPNWSWDVLSVHFDAKYVSVTGRLTIKGVSRDGVGGNSPNGANSPVSEDTVKGAETDALKRAALRFGVGLYLRSAPTFWIDVVPNKAWEEAAAANKQFASWYNREFGKQSKGQPPPAPPPAPLAEVPRSTEPPPSSASSDDAPAGSRSLPTTVVTGSVGDAIDDVLDKMLSTPVEGTQWIDVTSIQRLRQKNDKQDYYRLKCEIGGVTSFSTTALTALGIDYAQCVTENKIYPLQQIVSVPYFEKVVDGRIYLELDNTTAKGLLEQAG